MSSHVQRLAAVTATCLSVHETASRRTGRTEEIVRMVEPGDQVVVSSREEKRFFEGELRRAGKDGVHVLVHDPSRGRIDNIRPATDGRTYFESTWSYLFFLQQVEEVSRAFYRFEEHLNRHVVESPQTREPYTLGHEASDRSRGSTGLFQEPAGRPLSQEGQANLRANRSPQMRRRNNRSTEDE